MNSSNPRATTFVSTTKDENNAVKIINEFRSMENPTVHYILCKYIECGIIKNEPEFMEILFNDRINLVIEMVEWMLTPKLIAKKKKIKSNLDFFPYRCKQFMKDSISFYQQLYIAARSNKLPISIWFNFLRKEFYDKQTIMTALGYFAEVMVPFAKYEFSGSLNLTQSLQMSSFDTRVQTLSIMKILPKPLIEQIIQFSYYEPIFLFIKTAILVCIEDPSDFEISKNTILKILISSQTPNIFAKFGVMTPQTTQQLMNKIDLLNNVALALKQLIINIQPGNETQLRIQSFISVILESKIISYVVNQIITSKFCNQTKQKPVSSVSLDLGSSQELSSPRSPTINPLYLSQGSLPSPKMATKIMDTDQEDLMEILLTILTYSVQIFIRLPKTIPFSSETQDTVNLLDPKQTRFQTYKQIIIAYRYQMQFLLNNMQSITKLVFNQPQFYSVVQTRTIPSSSGQKIKAITFIKFECFKLIHNCLIMIQCRQNFDSKLQKLKGNQLKGNLMMKKMKSIHVEPFELNIENLHIIQIIEKYLKQNRWNNIVHHVLEKICHSLIICSYEYLSKNIEKDKNKKLQDSFLAFLIENFTSKHHIFLDTFRFTTQGNLHSLYNISKDLAYTLNSTNQLVILLNQFEPWKKFLIQDLKFYQQRTYPNSIKPDDDQDQETTYNDVSGLKVDEVDSIRKLIQNISSNKKWPTKISRNKGASKSGIIRNSDETTSGEDPVSMTKSYGFYIKNKKEPLKKTLDDLLKKKVEFSREYQNDNEVREVNVEEISVRQQLSMQKLTKSQVKGPFTEEKSQINSKKQIYGIFKTYAAQKPNKKDHGN